MQKILIIEDDEDVRMNIAEILEMEGFQLFTAENGRQGVQLARDRLPDIILCDILMPEMNGYEVLTEIRNNPVTVTMPFIFLTAKAATREIRTGMELGADDYLTKPFTIERLLAAIRAQLKKHTVVSQQLDELRTNLVLMLPHELLTPLNVIIGFSSLLREADQLPDPADIQSMGQAIYDNGLRLQRLVQNYLLYAELKLLQYQPNKHNRWQEKVPLETKNFLADLSFSLAKRTQRQQDLVLSLVNATIEISPKALVKIFEELLDNAFKFSLPGTPVQMNTLLDGLRFILEIRDQGRGMTSEQIAHIEAFMQFDRQKYEQQGQGLGLVLVHRLVELHGGTITIKSVPEKGTTVGVAFPISSMKEKA